MSSDTLTFGSMFSGIGGMDLGLERAGMKCLYQCEIVPQFRTILKKHWPEVPCYDDVTTIDTSDLPKVDVIAGGPPCQDFSYAGRRKKLSGERGQLSLVYWQKISEIRPKYVIMENVAGILDGGLDRILGQAALCGYDAEYDTVSAASVGAFHRRDRIFVVAVRRDVIADGDGGGRIHGQNEIIADHEGGGGRHSLNLSQAVLAADTPRTGRERRGGGTEGSLHNCRRSYLDGTVQEVIANGGLLQQWGDPPERSQEAIGWHQDTLIGPADTDNIRDRDFDGGINGGRIFARKPKPSDYWTAESVLGGDIHGIPLWLDDRGRPIQPLIEDAKHRNIRLMGYGLAVVPQVAEYVGRCVIAFHRRNGGGNLWPY